MGVQGTLYLEESPAEWAAQVVKTQAEGGSWPRWTKLSFSLSGPCILKPDLWMKDPVYLKIEVHKSIMSPYMLFFSTHSLKNITFTQIEVQ